MKKSRSILRPILLIFAILSIIICPLTSLRSLTNDSASASGLRQIDFTPHISPLELTQTADVMQIDPNLRATPGPNATLGPGQYFEENDPNKPKLDPDTIVGDKRFGFAELTDNPGLYAVWISDADGTHYLLVESTSEVLTGGTDTKRGFIYLADRRKTLHSQILTAVDKMNEYNNTANKFRLGTGGGAILWAACVWVTGGWCLPAVAIAGAFYGLSENKDSDADTQQILIEEYRREVYDCERFMTGKFTIGQAIYNQP